MLVRVGRLVRTMGRELLVLWHACRNPGTPRKIKLAALLLAIYVLSPVDLLPDWVPLLGIVDDVTLLAFAVPALLRLIPEPVLGQARGAAARWRLRTPWSPG